MKSKNEIDVLLKKLNQWSYDEKEKCIQKDFIFKSYLKNIAFVNAVAWLAHSRNHHPDLIVKFNLCCVKITTHDEDGLTDKDFELAAAIDKL